MRVFIALEMPDGAKDKLRPCLSQLKCDFPGVRWVAPQNLHLTLMFLGDVAADRLAALRDMLDAVATMTVPFVLGYKGVGMFRSHGEPHVIWLGVTPDERLQALAMKIGEGSRPYASPDDKPFHPHITLGRVRQPYRGVPLESAVDRLRAVDLPLWSVDTISLIQSQLTPQGPVYTTLSRHHLGGE